MFHTDFESFVNESHDKYQQYYTGTEEVKIDGQYVKVKVYYFDDDEETMNQFMDEVGGAPHPLGGNRAVVTA